MKPLLLQIGEPPARLQKARFENIALVPASLLLSKEVTYLPVVRRLPTGSVLCVSTSPRHEKIFLKIASFFHHHGHHVLTLPLERLAKRLQKPHPKSQQASLAL